MKFSRKSAVVLLVSGMLGFEAVSTMAVEIVRTSAGILASDYVTTIFPGLPPSIPGFSYVTHIPTNTIVCHDFTSFYCTSNPGWISGYTVTGNGLEVTKP